MKRAILQLFASLLFSLSVLNSCSKKDIIQESSTDQTSMVEKYKHNIGLSASNGNGNRSVSGGGSFVIKFFDLERVVQFALNAIEKKDGSIQGHLTYHSPEFDLQGKIDCISFNEFGNSARLSGIVTKVKSDDIYINAYYEGANFTFNVSDNPVVEFDGGNIETRDRVSDIWILNAGENCTNIPSFTIYPLTKGNINVKR